MDSEINEFLLGKQWGIENIIKYSFAKQFSNP